MMTKKILIITYTFPPYSGIGGRRWAKFSKYLQRLGHTVQVIAAESSLQQKNSSWICDTEELINKPIFIKSGYKEFLGINPQTFYQKVRYRFAKFITQLQVKGNYYDKSIFWKANLLPIVESYIAKGYNNVIITGAPFKITFDLCIIKEKHKHINFIVDFRDPWIGNETAYGYYSLSKKRQNYEKHMQEVVVQSANYVISVNDQMTSDFNILYGTSNKNLTINNGFDWDDISLNHTNQPPKDKLRFILCGSLYGKALHVFKVFIEALNKLKIENLNYYNLLKIDFYGDVPSSFNQLTKNIDVVNYHGFISLKDVYTEIAQSQVCMLFMTDDLNHSFSTKFYEYIAMKKTIVVFTKKGKTGEFVQDNGLGYMLTLDNMYEELVKVISDYKKNNLVNNPTFNLDFFDVAKLVNKIDKLLI